MIEKPRVVTEAGAVTVAADTAHIVLANKRSRAATAVNLPTSPSTGQTFIIEGGKGDAATHTITLTPTAGNIDGAGPYVISTYYGQAQVTSTGSAWSVTGYERRHQRTRRHAELAVHRGG